MSDRWNCPKMTKRFLAWAFDQAAWLQIVKAFQVLHLQLIDLKALMAWNVWWLRRFRGLGD